MCSSSSSLFGGQGGVELDDLAGYGFVLRLFCYGSSKFHHPSLQNLGDGVEVLVGVRDIRVSSVSW